MYATNTNKRYENFKSNDVKTSAPENKSFGEKVKDIVILTGGGSIAGLLLTSEICVERKALYSGAALGGMIGFLAGVLASLAKNTNNNKK